jgi:hypothetical protein
VTDDTDYKALLERLNNEHGRPIIAEAIHAIEALLRERDEARAETVEQARLLGMGAEREARLTAERDEAQKRYVNQRMDCDTHMQLATDRAEAAESQVGALREALEEAVGCAKLQYEMRTGYSPESPPDSLFGRMDALLASTATAAAKRDRRLRIEGAEAMEAEWVRCSTRGLDVPRLAAVVDAKFGEVGTSSQR